VASRIVVSSIAALALPTILATPAHIDFALPRMSLISGRVTDEDGDPVAGATMLAMQSTCIAGRRQLVPTSPANVPADDVGEYRIGGLVPGTCVVSAGKLPPPISR
jgi:hypothetical protein